MKLLSVNVSLPREIRHDGKTVRTGIFKQPISDRVMLRELNIEGDGQADLIGHGGIYKAAYVYSIENYRYWETELGRSDFDFGQFGENFTVEGMLDDAIHLGDTFRIGGALVEVSQPRVPCFKLGIRMGIQGFEHVLLSSNRIGFYLRVLEEGEVGAGDTFEPVDTEPERMSVAEALLRSWQPRECAQGTTHQSAVTGLARLVRRPLGQGRSFGQDGGRLPHLGRRQNRAGERKHLLVLLSARGWKTFGAIYARPVFAN